MPARDDEDKLRAEMLGEDTSGEAETADLAVAIAADASFDVLSTEDLNALRAEGIDPFHPILNVEEQREAIAAANARVAKDAKLDAKKALEKQVYDAQRGKTSLRTGNPELDELVTCTLDLAEHSDRILINGHEFWHGHTYTLPRHVANSLREIQQRGHHHQADLDGKGISERGKKPRLTMVTADKQGNITNIQNAPQRAA